jgi:Transposase DDE domain
MCGWWDSTPVECGRSRETVRRSDLAGLAQYGYCASHSRYFWGLRLHLVATLGGLPVAFALAGAKADEQQVLLSIFQAEPDLVASRPGQMLIGDKNYYGHGFESILAQAGFTLLRPARKGEPDRPGARFLKPLRQVIESVNQTLKPSSTSSATAAAPRPGSSSGCSSASWPRPPRSGSTTKPQHRFTGP